MYDINIDMPGDAKRKQSSGQEKTQLGHVYFSVAQPDRVVSSESRL